MLPPVPDLPASIPQVRKPTRIQAFVAQTPVETFHMPVLHGLPRLNVHCGDLLLDAPGQVMPTGEFGPIIGSQSCRPAVHCHGVLQHARHAAARKACVRLQRQTHARVGVDHAEHANPPAAGGHVAGKIQCPLLIGRRKRRTRTRAPAQPASPQPLYLQSRGTVHPLHTLVVHPHSLLSQQNAQTPVAVARLCVRQLHQLLLQLRVVFPAPVPVRRSRNLDQLAGMPLTGRKLLYQPLHFRSPHYEPKWFFLITDCNMSLSRLRSATSFLSRAFSSRSAFTSCASLTSMPPYFAF